jgi:selenocysteine lyase/cysteine desulfurase
VVVDDLHYSTEFVLYRALEASRWIELRIVKNRDGAVAASAFEPHIDKRTRIVSVAWVSHLNGFRHNMRPIADLAHAHGALFYADAVQAVGMIDIDVRAAGVDALCCGSYKWLMVEFGVAPYFGSRDIMDRIRIRPRWRIFGRARRTGLSSSVSENCEEVRGHKPGLPRC